MLDTNLVRRFILAATEENVAGHEAVLSVFDRFCPSENDGDFEAFNFMFDDDASDDVIDIIRVANRLKNDIYPHREELPKEVYEYLAAYKLIENDPRLIEELSPQARAIADEVDPYFTTMDQTELPHNPAATYAALVRSYVLLSDFHVHVVENIGDHLKFKDENFEKVILPAFTLAQHETSIEEAIRYLARDILFYYNFHAHEDGWYIPFTQKHFGNDFDGDLSSMNALPIPDDYKGLVERYYQFSFERSDQSAHKTFINTARYVIRPLQMAHTFFGHDNQTALLSAMYSYGRHDDDFKDFFDTNVNAELRQLLDKFHADDWEESADNQDIYISINEGHAAYLVTQLSDFVTEFTGISKPPMVSRDDVASMHGVLLTLDRDIQTRNPEFAHEYRAVRGVAIAWHNEYAEDYGFPLVAEDKHVDVPANDITEIPVPALKSSFEPAAENEYGSIFSQTLRGVAFRSKGQNGTEELLHAAETLKLDPTDSDYEGMERLSTEVSYSLLNMFTCGRNHVDDFFGKGTALPSHVYECLISYEAISLFPELKNKISPKAQALHDEVLSFFDENNQDAISLHAEFCALTFIYEEVAHAYDDVRFKSTSKDDLYLKAYDQKVKPYIKYLQGDTHLEDVIKGVIKDIHSFVSLADSECGKYYFEGQKLFGEGSKHSCDFIDELEDLEDHTESLKCLYDYFVKAYKNDSYDTYVAFTRAVIRPIEILQQTIDEPTDVHYRAAMCQFGRYDNDFKAYLAESLHPDLVNAWTIIDNDMHCDDEWNSYLEEVDEGSCCSDLSTFLDLEQYLRQSYVPVFLPESSLDAMQAMFLETPASFETNHDVLQNMYENIRGQVAQTYNLTLDMIGSARARIADNVELPIVSSVSPNVDGGTVVQLFAPKND